MSFFPRRRAWIAAVLAVLLLCACTAFKRFAYEGFGRDDWQKPGEVVAALAIRSGDRVADLGSGGGYFTFRLAQAVGPAGKVYAVDVDSALLDDLAERAKEQGYGNVARVLAKYDDPMLPVRGRVLRRRRELADSWTLVIEPEDPALRAAIAKAIGS